ncbi:MAG TPA: DUF5715 family protein [Terriglobales bacterium]
MITKSKAICVGVLMGALSCASGFALNQSVPTQHHTRSAHAKARRVRWNPVFKPSADSLLRQNAEIDRLELPRIQNDQELRTLVANEQLLPIVPSQSLRIDPRLVMDRRYCRPWTLEFLSDLSSAYYDRFHDQIQVNSAVRTVQVQKKLRRHNRNAAPEVGEFASSHLAGITVDIQRRGMTRQQIQFVEAFMMPLREQGLVEPEEERRQWVFHVAVSGRYSEWRQQQMFELLPAISGEPVSVEPSRPVLQPISTQGDELLHLDGLTARSF